MVKEIGLFKSEERQAMQSVSAFLHQTAARLAHYQVILHSGGEELALDIPNIVLLEFKVEEENEKPLLSIPHSARN